jgi:cell division protein ZapA (FtsZ GTPase activity inhibitor)
MNTPVEAEKAEEVVSFLNRFSAMISKGSNADNLRHAAELLAAQVEMVRESSELLQIERGRFNTAFELCKSLEDLNTRFESEIANLKWQLSEQKHELENAIVAAAKERDQLALRLVAATSEKDRLLARAEQAEARLLEFQSREAALGDTHILVPITTLQLAEAQFELLAREFQQSGNIVSQAMCTASASTLGRAVLVAIAPQSAVRSKNAA